MLVYESNGIVLFPHDERAEKHCAKTKGLLLDLTVRGHSLKEHSFLFAYMTFLFQQLKNEYDDPEVFRHQVSLDVDHVKIFRIKMLREQIERLLAMCEARDGWVDLRVPKSWSFGKSHHEEFHPLANRVSGWGYEHTGIDIEEWQKKHSQYMGA